MAWTYVDPTGMDRDRVRFLIGDTDTTDQQLQDEEIAWLLTEASNDVYRAAIDACGSLQAKYARAASKKDVGDLSIQYNDRAASYAALAKTIEARKDRQQPATPWVKPESIVQAKDRIGSSTGTEFAVGGLDNVGR